MKRFVLLCTALAAASPSAAIAASEWAVFDAAVGNSQTGRFFDGRTVQMTAYYISSGVLPAGGAYTANPAVPGRPDDRNPSGAQTLTGPTQQSVLDPGALIMSLDLSGITVNADTIFGINDMMDIMRYRLELLDGQGSPLSLAAVQVTNHNLDLDNFPFDADYDITFDPSTGSLRVNLAHDANNGSTYRHSGLALFTNLPAGAELLRIVSDSTAQQSTEGVTYYLAGTASEVPAPAAFWLFATGIVGLARFARRRRSRAA